MPILMSFMSTKAQKSTSRWHMFLYCRQLRFHLPRTSRVQVSPSLQHYTSKTAPNQTSGLGVSGTKMRRTLRITPTALVHVNSILFKSSRYVCELSHSMKLMWGAPLAQSRSMTSCKSGAYVHHLTAMSSVVSSHTCHSTCMPSGGGTKMR